MAMLIHKGEPMQSYTFEVSRISYDFAEIIVEAENETEARTRITDLVRSTPIHFSDGPVQFEIELTETES